MSLVILYLGDIGRVFHITWGEVGWNVLISSSPIHLLLTLLILFLSSSFIMVSPMQRINAARRAGERNRESSVFVFNEENHTVGSSYVIPYRW